MCTYSDQPVCFPVQSAPQVLTTGSTDGVGEPLQLLVVGLAPVLRYNKSEGT